MRRISAFLFILRLATGIAVPAQESEPPTGDVVVVCPVTGVIERGIAVIVKRALDEAHAMGAKAVLFEIDTPGGRVDSAVEISTAINNARMPTIAYVEGMGGISAGALISFACDRIVMEPGSAIGAATPVIATPEGMQPTGEKEVSFMRAKMRALAESNGHNPHLAQAMVDKDIELRGYTNQRGEYVVYAVGGSVSPPDESAQKDNAGTEAPTPEDILRRLTGVPEPDTPEPEPEPQPTPPTSEPGTVVFEEGSELVLAAGKLLTLTPNEAEKYGLIPEQVRGRDDAIDYLELEDVTYYEIEANWAEEVFAFLTDPTVAGLLLLVGMGGLYFEVRTPGIGLPGLLAVIALALLFGSHFVLGLADTIDLVLIAAGIILLLVEAFVIPGFGIAGFSGLLCLMIGTYLAFVDFTVPEYSWDFDRLEEVGYSMTLAAVTFILLVLGTWKLLPRTPFYRTLVASVNLEDTKGYLSPVQDRLEPQLGMRGETESMLRPVGRARFGDTTLQVVTRGAYIPKGAPVEIIDLDGSRIVVTEVEENA